MGSANEERNRIMRAVKSRDTMPEMLVRRVLHRMGFRYRLHAKDLPGKPDILFPKKKKVIFVHGCFWHGHGCKRGNRPPKTNQAYWLTKIQRTVQRDQKIIAMLAQADWSVLAIWECELKDRQSLMLKLKDFLLDTHSQ